MTVFCLNCWLEKKQFLAAILVALLLNSHLVYAAEASESLGETKKTPLQAMEERGGQFTCANPSMSDEDSQRFLDLLRDGFLGSEYSSGSPENTARDKLANPTVVIPLGDDKNTARKVEMADQKFDANEAQHIFNDHISGPYSYGLVLTDTLRVGRCTDLKDQNIPCPMEGKQLSLRNSGTGFVSDFKPIKEFFGEIGQKIKGAAVSAGETIAGGLTGKDYNWTEKEQSDWTDEDYEGMRKALGLPENSSQELKELAASSDLNETRVQTMSRLVKEMIPNSILASTFNAYSQTTCNTSDCIINVYSLFDKYYNNWFSTEMVISNAAPTLISRAKKLFMNIGRRGFFPKIKKVFDEKIMDAIRRRFMGPGTAYYERLGRRMWARAEGIPDVGRLRFELMETQGWQDGMLLLKSREFRNKLEKEWMNTGGWFDQISEGRVQKEMYQFAEDVRKWQKIQRAVYNDAKEPYMQALKAYGLGHPSEVAARIDFGQKISKIMTSSEDMIHLDIPEWFSRDGSARLFYYGVKPQGSDATRWLASDSIDIYNVMKKFEADGHWGGMWPTQFSFENAGKNLNLYAFDPSATEIAKVTADDLKTHFSQFTDIFVKTDPGEVMPVKDATLPYVSKVMTGQKPMYAGAITKAKELSPEEFAQRLVNNRRLESMLTWYGPDNADKLVYGLQAKGFMKRNYTSLLDRALMNQDELLKNYFGSKTGPFKWTALLNTYWFAKRGFGQEGISAYMLPDSWREIRWPLGSDPIYNDAFIDFFSHEGSDQGDMFRRVVSAMPWEFIAGQLIENYAPAKKLYENFTGGNIRNEVENIAFYGTTQNECSGCGVSLDTSNNFQSFSAFFYASDRFKSYMIEDAVSEAAKKKGNTLITFAHHTNLQGKESGASTSGEINLKTAIAKKQTCQDKAQEALFGLGRATGAFSKDSVLKPSAIGGVLAFGESALYMTAFWAGIFGSVFQQVVVASQLQDCVDVDEGYYTHIFAPSKEEKKGTESSEALSTEKAMDMAEKFSGQLIGMFKSDTNSYTSKAAEALDRQVKDFFEGASQSDIVQATVEIPGFSSGKLSGEQLFSFWYKGETSPLEYKTEGIKKIASQDGNRFVIVDFNTGKVYVVDENGQLLQTITENELATRSASTNTRIPAEEFGKRFTLIGLPKSAELLFEMDTDGELTVKIPSVIECLLQGIKFQSGLDAKSDSATSFNLTPIFGKVETIVTDSHPSIMAWPEDKRIVAEGTPRLIMEGSEAKARIHADRNTYLWRPDQNMFVGLFKSIQFKNGVILYKPDTHELLVWLKRHELGQLSSDDVAGVKLKPATSRNPLTDCPEPAVNLEVLPSDKSSTTAFKVNAFNEALQNVGPFTILETPTRRFIFYSKLEPDGTCKDYFRVIDKQTGEIYDAPIESMTVTPDGIKIKTEDGKSHNLGIDAKNGIPMVTYNNYPPEPLTMAQGRNGSFWYDTEKNTWNAENAQLLPLLEAFKNGALTQVGANGQVVTTPGNNIMNISTGASDGGLFNLPSWPQELPAIVFSVFGITLAIHFLVYKRKKLVQK
ncbi:MAG: hypothetical protein QXK06_03995 [Candidatus Diapherotrites archaeon]